MRSKFHEKFLAGALACALAASLVPAAAPAAFAASADASGSVAAQASAGDSADDDADDADDANDSKNGKVSPETYDNASYTPDSDGFFQALSGRTSANLDTKLELGDLEKLGIYLDAGDAEAQGVADTHVTESGAGSFTPPVTSASADGASISYDKLVTINLDDAVFAQAAGLSYVNNNGVSVSCNERDTIQAVLYAIAGTTQEAGFDGKTMYRVKIDHEGTIELTNCLFVYSNTWLSLGQGTVMKKEYQSAAIASERADRTDAENRQIAATNVKLLRNTAGELTQGGYQQCANIVVDGGTWDANLEHYNTSRLGSGYGEGNLGFAHMKNLVVQDTAIKGANSAHHLELSGVRNATVSKCSFSGYNGAAEKEAIQIEPLHSKGTTRDCKPYDDTPSRNVIVYGCSFRNCSRGVGNHTALFGLDTTRIYVRGNTFENLSGQAVLTVGCKTMRIEKNTMRNVATGVDVRIVKRNSTKSAWLPRFENWTYAELVDAGFLNRDIKVLDNVISATGHSSINAGDCYGVAISVKGQTISAADTALSKKIAGNYTVEGVTVRDNTVTSATGTGVRFYNTRGCSCTGNTVKSVSTYAGRGIGLYITRSTGLSARGNAISSTAGNGIQLSQDTSASISSNTLRGIRGYGVYQQSSTRTSIAGNKISMAGKKAAVYTTTGTSTGTSARSNTVVVNGTTAMSLGEARTVAFKRLSASKKKVSGKTAGGKKVTAYANGKKLGSAKSDAKGAFKIKFKKKQAKGTVIQLRYKGAGKNSIRAQATI